MKRRQPAAAPVEFAALPENLLRPVRADWPGGETEVDEARRVWLAGHGYRPADLLTVRKWEVQSVRWSA